MMCGLLLIEAPLCPVSSFGGTNQHPVLEFSAVDSFFIKEIYDCQWSVAVFARFSV